MSDSLSQAILPDPPEELKRTSRALAEKLRERAKVEGFMSFRTFMEAALYEPGLGYYSAGLAKFGADGDFVTAPELGSVFGRCLAAQATEVGAALGSWDILEIGAGSGRLAADVLEATGGAGPGRYRILERSADLRSLQRETIGSRRADLLARVEWLDAPPREPWQGVILANEVIDALAVERFQLHDEIILQAGVTIDGDALGWATREAPTPLTHAVQHVLAGRRDGLANGYTSEICPMLPAWLEAVTGTLARGAALFIDYGYPRDAYYRAARDDGTLVCHYRHHAHGDPFFWPGLQDISAFVDFTALAEAADACGLDCAGYTSQAQFLIGCGLEEVLTGMSALPDAARFQLAHQVRELTLPGAMGEKFQVMALTRDFDAPLRGFVAADLRGYL